MDFDEAVSFLASRLPGCPTVFITYTNALGQFPDILKSPIQIPSNEIPHFPAKKQGLPPINFLFGRVSDLYVLVQQGRYHRHEGYTQQEISFPVKMARCLGCSKMLVSNGAGAIGDRFKLGDVMLIESHVVLSGGKENPRLFREVQKEVEESSKVYDGGFMEVAKRVVIEEGMDKYVKTGSYAMIEDTTPKNYGDLINWRNLGVDALGTSLVEEVITANKLGMKVFAMSIITDEGILDYEKHPEPLLEDISKAINPKKSLIKKLILKFIHYAKTRTSADNPGRKI